MTQLTLQLFLLNQFRGLAKGFQEEFQEQNKPPAHCAAVFAEAV